MLVRQRGLVEPGPDQDDPGAAPAGSSAAVCESPLERRPGRGGERRLRPRRDRIVRDDREEMREVAMSGLLSS